MYIVQDESCQHRVVRRGGGTAGRCLGLFIETLFCMQTGDSISFHNRCYIKLKSNQLGQPTVSIVLRYEQYGILIDLLNPTPLFADCEEGTLLKTRHKYQLIASNP